MIDWYWVYKDLMTIFHYLIYLFKKLIISIYKSSKYELHNGFAKRQRLQ